jgi:hypothetical protein
MIQHEKTSKREIISIFTETYEINSAQDMSHAHDYIAQPQIYIKKQNLKLISSAESQGKKNCVNMFALSA